MFSIMLSFIHVSFLLMKNKMSYREDLVYRMPNSNAYAFQFCRLFVTNGTLSYYFALLHFQESLKTIKYFIFGFLFTQSCYYSTQM
jgi:hypothetical protein